MTRGRLRLAYGVVNAVIQSGGDLKYEDGFFAGPVLDAIRSRPWVPGSDVTDEEISQVLHMTLKDILAAL
jgi:hypothetical protein